MQGHQRVSCVPGIASLARKNRLIATLVQHYGEGAFELTPRSWLLPNQYWQWRLRAEAQVPLYTMLDVGRIRKLRLVTPIQHFCTVYRRS